MKSVVFRMQVDCGRSVMFMIFVVAAFIRWVFMYEKGYQTVDTAISSVFTKVKGVSYTNISEVVRIWDVADYVFPEQVGCAS